MSLSTRAVFLILIVYSLLVFASLGATPLWLDEVLHFSAVRNITWTELITWVQVNAGAVPLSYLLQQGSVRLFGLSPITARLSAALASIVGAMVFIAILRRLKIGAPMLGLLVFLAVPLQFRYAVEGVGYSLGLCFCLISFWIFLRFKEAPSPAWAAAYAISIVLGLYSQPLVIFPALAQIVWLARFGTQRQLALAAGASAAAVLVFLPWYFAQREVQQQAGSMKIVFFAWQQVRPLVLLHSATGGGYAVAIPLILLAGYGVYSQRNSAEHLLIALTLAAAWVGPILMDGIVNYFFAPRQLLFSIPFLVLLAASGAEELRLHDRAWPSAIFAVVILGGSLFSDYGQAVHSKDDLMVVARTAQEWIGQDGCLAVAPPNWVAYFKFFEPGLADHKCNTPGSPARVVAIRAVPAMATPPIPPGYSRTKEAKFRDIDLTMYEPVAR